MDENKNLNEIEAQDIPADNSEDEAVRQEMEQVRDIFQQELDKATAEAESAGEDENDARETEENPEEELCLCCGEKEKVPGKDYCEDCLDAMRHYPFKWVYFLVAAVFVYVAVLGIIKITKINRGYVLTYEGTVLAEAGLRDNASEKFEMATNYLYRDNIYAKLVYMRSLENSFKMGSLSNLPTAVATIYSEWELGLPHMKKLKAYYEESQEFVATATDINEMLAEYDGVSNNDLPYEEIIKKIADFEKRNLYIGLTEDGEEVTEPTTEAVDGTMSSSNETYSKRKTTYHKGLIEYYKYYVADLCSRSSEEKIEFLEAARKDDPKKFWLYASELGAEYIKVGEYDKALALADEIYSDSEADVETYIIRASVAKNRDKDFDKSIDYCNEGINQAQISASQETAAYELYRILALNYLAKGEYETALENAQTAYDTYNSLASCNTLAFCSLAAGKTEKYDEIAQLFKDANEEYGEEVIKFSAAVTQLKDGKATVEQILEQGGYDVA